jgi:hypothetical protein
MTLQTDSAILIYVMKFAREVTRFLGPSVRHSLIVAYLGDVELTQVHLRSTHEDVQLQSSLTFQVDCQLISSRSPGIGDCMGIRDGLDAIKN